MIFQNRINTISDLLKTIKDWKLLVAIFAGALIIRIIFISLFSEVEYPNFQYDTIGWNLVQGNGYSMDIDPPYSPSAYRPPVYPFFLATIYKLFGHSYFAVKVMQSIVGALTCVLIYLISIEVFSRKVGIISALISSVYPAFLYYTNTLIMEIVLIFIVAVTVLLFVKVVKHKTLKYQIAFGISIGIASLCRPAMLLYPFFALLFMYFIYPNKKEYLKHGGLMLIAMLLVLTPWTIRNYVVFGKILPVVAKGMGSQIWTGLRTVEMDPHDLEDRVFKSAIEIQDSLTAGRTEIDAQEMLLKLAVQEILNNPIDYVIITIKKVGQLWYHPIGAIRTLPKYSQIAANLLIIAYYIMLGLALTGLIMSFRNRILYFAPFIITIFYFTAVHSLLLTLNRYRVSALPFVIIFSAYGLSELYYRLMHIIRPNDIND